MVGRTAGKAQCLDHRSRLRPPQPCAAGDERVWHREREGTAGQRQAVGQQPAAELGQEAVGGRRGAGLVHQPGEVRGQIHGVIMPSRPPACHAATTAQAENSQSEPVRPCQGSGPGSRPAATSASRSR